MAKDRPQEEEAGSGAPDWIVTFSDMISLLVTFFILLLTFSSLDDYDVFMMPNQIEGLPGTMENVKGPSANKPPKDDQMSAAHPKVGADIPHSRPVDELTSDLSEMGQKKTPDHTEFDLAKVKDGLVIRYDQESSFKPGSVEVNPKLREALIELARVLEHYQHLVVIQGFTDDRFVATRDYPTAEALSLGRATAAARVMIENSKISFKLLQVAGIGSERPLSSNETATARRANRRVEVRILSLSESRSTSVRGDRR